MTESELQSAVIEMARLFGWLVHHDRPSQNSKGRWSTAIQGDPGFPDLVLARDGVVLFVELKSAKGKMSDAQTEWFTALSGGPVVGQIWRPEDLRDRTIEAALR